MFELIRKYGKKYQLVSMLAASAKLIEVVFDLLIPLVIRHMIDAGVATQDVSVVSRDALLLVTFTIVGYLSTLICQILASRISQGFGCDLREQAFKSCLSMGVDELSSLGVSSALNRLTSDINQVQLAVALAIRQLVRWPFIALGSVIAAAYVDLRLALILLASLALISLVMYAVVRQSVPLFGKVQEHLDKLIQVARELIEGARTIRTFGRQSYEEELFSEAAQNLSETNRSVASLSAALGPATTLILNLGIAAILALGAGRVDGGELSQGSLVSLVSYMSNTLLAVIFVANLFAIFTKAQASAKRILELLDGQHSVEEMRAAKEQFTEAVVHTNEGDVAARFTHTSDEFSNTSEGLAHTSDEVLLFNDVSFSYPDAKAPALKNIYFSLKAGESLGIMGGTGSGKTSLLSLIVGLRKPTSGTISLFGKDLNDLSANELQSLISYVPQKSALMEGRLRENLSWRDEHASDSELEEALTLAQAADFVDALEGALDSHVEAGGKNFSGGQLQRLAIARALVGDPKLLLLDDAAASLDAISAANFREALKAKRGLTTVTVSESVAALKDCDKILLLDQGALIAAGTHEELLANSTLYREFYVSQMALKGLDGLS